MEMFFIYDSNPDEIAFEKMLSRDVTHIHLFPLSSKQSITENIYECLRYQNSHIRLHESADIIEQEVKELRKNIFNWSHQLGELQVKSKNIKDWFLLPSLKISTWWLGQLSETNTLQTDAFLQIAQINAIKKSLHSLKIDALVVTVKDKLMRKSLANVARSFNIPIIYIYETTQKQYRLSFHNIKEFIRTIKNSSYLLAGFMTLITILMRKIKAFKILGNISKRLNKSSSLAFISYFPLIDKKSADKGILYDNFAKSVQIELREKNISITWLLMPVPADGMTYAETCYLAKKLADQGEVLFILYEFLTIKNIFIALSLWVRQILKSRFLLKYIRQYKINISSISQECEPIITDLWKKSFMGTTSMLGILYLLIYKQVWSDLNKISQCFYYCEMQSWEKALNAMKKLINPSITTIGFQHSSIPRNNFHYFYSPKDVTQHGRASDFPLPDKIAGNGHLMVNYLKESNFPNILQLESARYLYLNSILHTPITRLSTKPFLLVACSIKFEETCALLMLVKQAFPQANEIDIWVKTHPSLHIDEIANRINFNLQDAGYRICENGITTYLPEANAVLSLSSTVIMEALAFGCEIILPVFPDSILMNPLSDFEDFYHRVTSSIELKNTVLRIASGNQLKTLEKKREFITAYWDLNPTLAKWKALLNIG